MYRLEAGRPENRNSISGGSEDIPLRPLHTYGFWGPARLLPLGTKGSYAGVKQSKRASDHSLHLVPKAMKDWRHISTPPYSIPYVALTYLIS